MNPDWIKKVKKHRRMWLVPVVLFGLIVLAIIIASGKQPPFVEEVKRAATNVEVETIEPQPYTETIVLPARLMADKEVCLYSETNGILDYWFVEEGALVHQGEIVAQMERDALLVSERKQAAAVKVAETQVELARIGAQNVLKDKETADLAVNAAESSFTVADKEFKRAKELLEDGFLDRSAFEAKENARTQALVVLNQVQTKAAQADIAIEEAQANLKLAQDTLESERATLEEIQIDLSKTQITSPIEGILDKHLVQPGELASPGTMLGCIYKNDVMRAEVDVPDRQIPFLDQENTALRKYIELQAPGAELDITAKVIIPGLPKLTGGFQDGITLPATVKRIAAKSNEASNTFQVELELPNPGRALRQGVLARAEINLLSYPKAIVIPLKAVQVSELGPRVYVVEGGEDGKLWARVRDIEPTSINQGQLLIAKGLEPGDKLIVAGHRSLVDKAPVWIIRADGELLNGNPSGETSQAAQPGRE